MMNLFGKVLIIIVGLFLISGSTIYADKAIKPEIKNIQRPAIPEEIDRQVRLARQLISHKDYAGAAALLEPVYEEIPNQSLLYNLLRQCYDKLGYLPRVQDLANQMIEQYPGECRYRLDLARVQMKLQESEAGLESFYKAVELAGSDGDYLNITNSMMSVGFAEEALILMESFREKISNPSAFALQKGALLEAQRLYREAVFAYLPLLADTTRDAANAERRLLALLNFVSSSEQAESTLLESITDSNNLHGLKPLTAFYLKNGRLDEAMAYTLQLDSLQGNNGQALVRFMRSCRERREYALAISMGEYFFNYYNQGPVMIEAYLVYAGALTQTNQFDEAITVYDNLVSYSPRIQDQAEGLYNIGMIYLDQVMNYDAARTYFDSVVNHYTRGIGYIKSHMARPYCDLRKGDLSIARGGFLSLARMRLNDDMMEEVDFRLAQIEFCMNNFDSANVQLQRLMVDYSSGFYVNDAMRLLMVTDRIGENKSLMSEYAKVTEYELRRMPDSLEAALVSLTEGPSANTLGDFALYRLVNMSLTENDTTSVLEYVRRLEERFPESYYYPYGLKARGDIYYSDNSRIEDCKLIYRQLLEQFPNYPFTSEVRQKLRSLEDQTIG